MVQTAELDVSPAVRRAPADAVVLVPPVEAVAPVARLPAPPRFSSDSLASRLEPFDSFWEAPHDVEAGYRSFGRFYRANYLDRLPADPGAAILVVSAGPGYFLQVLRDEGYRDAVGIDSAPDKVEHAVRRGLDCRLARAFEFLASSDRSFDAIVCEQELNHLTKPEMIAFLSLCRDRLAPGGRLIVHSLNGANPITGAEALAQNFDHHCTLTEYSLRQVLGSAGFVDVEVFSLRLYVFWANPLNYLAWAASVALAAAFRAAFVLYGKDNRLWSKKIGAVARRP